MTDENLYRSATENEAGLADRSLSSGSKWPFPGMQIGDAIAIDGREHFENATSSYKYSAKRYGMKFTRKTVDGSLIIKRIS